MMESEILRAELERSFELDELLHLSRNLLGFEPDVVGGATAKGSFAGALTRHCVEQDALEALCDALVATRPEAAQRITELRASGVLQDGALAPGQSFGPFSELTPLGEGRLGFCYQARRGNGEYRLKVLKPESLRDRRDLHRFMTATRLLATVEHPGLPRQVETGFVEGRAYVAHASVAGASLSQHLQGSLPVRFSEARGLLRSLLQALAALHEKRLAHGDLRFENVLVASREQGDPHAVLLDAGSDRLRTRPPLQNGKTELFSSIGSVKTLSPEQIRGRLADPRSDVYAFGALVYEVLTGRAPFDASGALEAAFAHLTQAAAPPSQHAPAGYVSADLDRLVLRLLAKEPLERPATAGEVLELLEQLQRTSRPPQAELPDGALEAELERLTTTPDDPELLASLEARASSPEATQRIADALLASSRALDGRPDGLVGRLILVRRAARLLGGWPETREGAERAYAEALELSPGDPELLTAAIELKRRSGKWDEAVELWLLLAEHAPGASEKARCFAEIGRIYASERHEPDQALVAFAQALCENPSDGAVAAEIERLAGSSTESWSEVLQTCTAAAGEQERAGEHRRSLFDRAGRWWLQRLQRADLALPCFQAALALDNTDETALEGRAQGYRQTQQWNQLGGALTLRADLTASPALARDLRTEAAELLELVLGDPDNARALYERVVSEDPSHTKAVLRLSKLYESNADFERLLRLLEQSVVAQQGDERLQTLCKIAELRATKLGEDMQAQRGFEHVLEQQPDHLEALRGLERLLTKAGRFKELLENLERQVELSLTPRQTIGLLERIAGIHEQEFLSHGEAARAFERVIELDPGNEAALTALSRHYRSSERWDDLARVYERHLKLTSDASIRVALLLARARLFAEELALPESALAAYQALLELEPEHPQALEAVARLRVSSGDSAAALLAIEALAQHAKTPEARAEQWTRAAKLLESQGARDAAIERYQRALDESPKNVAASAALREAFAARGDTHAVLQLLERELEHTEGALGKARLTGRIAVLLHEKLQDAARAEDYAKKALELDPTNLEALLVLGDIAFENGRPVEASKHYEAIAGRVDMLESTTAVRALLRYLETLTQTGGGERAGFVLDTLLRLAPDDLAVLESVAEVTFAQGDPLRAAELYARIATHFAPHLTPVARARALYRQGQALSKAGQPEAAVPPLEEAADLDPSSSEPLIALAQALEAQGKWVELLKVKSRHLESAVGEERVQLLLGIADIAGSKLGDRAQAAKSLVAALEERPDDRRLLTKLMQLYSEDKDWNKLVEVVLRLADFVDEPKQRVKYLHTAAIVTARHIGETQRALEYYQQVLELEPTFDKARNEAIELYRELADHGAVERLLRSKLELASASENQDAMVEAFDQLGALYERSLGWNEQAVDAYEAAHTLAPHNDERRAVLARLYAMDPERYLEKAVAGELELLRGDPHRVESYKVLRRLYTETKRADSAWCLCQAMSVLGLAEADEERFYRRMKSETAAPAQNALDDEEWLSLLMHPDADPLLTSIFALIEPAVIARRSQTLAELGYDETWSVSLAENP
ncbi:MAG TPA: tetratricopeptide repeat protein, partial [Polyangiaceae bacterium]|nr:tetratricopeptide repeat protein [Polyangiaceae bacterium]